MIKPTIPHRKWHPQEIEVVRQLISIYDKSPQYVADRFHTTKNAIIGLCHRNNIKHSDTYIQVNKPVAKPVVKDYGAKITKYCLFCEVPFQSFKSLERKFCKTSHATAYHNRANSIEIEMQPKLKRTEYLSPSPNAKKCLCGAVAVPKHKVCYQQKRECYG